MSAGIDVRAAALTDVGRVRDQNEDACFSGVHVFAVADGLGGHSAGEVASSIALEPIAALDKLGAKRAATQLGDALRRANRTVFDRQQHNEALKGMGTTLTALAIDGTQATLGHVGDSRCYLIRGGAISQITSDHTLVARMVEEGRLTVEQAENHPQRSILTRALGNERDVEIEEDTFDLAPGDVLILCSDGLTSVMSDEEILEFAAEAAVPTEICRALIDEANERGGPDNITVVAVEIGGTGAPLRKHPTSHRHRRRIPARALVWVAIVLVVLGGMSFGVRAWANASWYVGIAGEDVAIYHGLPVSFAGIHLSSIEELTKVRADSLPPALRASLADGIPAGSLDDARTKVSEQIAPAARPTQSPTPKASPKPSPKPSPRVSKT